MLCTVLLVLCLMYGVKELSVSLCSGCLLNVHRDELGKTQSELMATKEVYVNVCKVKDELEDKVHNLQSENAQTKVEICTVRLIELLAL